MPLHGQNVEDSFVKKSFERAPPHSDIVRMAQPHDGVNAVTADDEDRVEILIPSSERLLIPSTQNIYVSVRRIPPHDADAESVAGGHAKSPFARSSSLRDRLKANDVRRKVPTELDIQTKSYNTTDYSKYFHTERPQCETTRDCNNSITPQPNLAILY